VALYAKDWKVSFNYAESYRQMYGCFGCMACDEICPAGIKPSELTLAMRYIQEK